MNKSVEKNYTNNMTFNIQTKLTKFPSNISSIKSLTELCKNLFNYITNNILLQDISNEKKEKVSKYFHKIFSIIKIISTEKKNLILNYDSILKLSEEKIRTLYSSIFNMKIKNTFLENNIDILIKKEKEYRLIKEKTGILVENGKIIHNDRKENEIFILRAENSNLKNVIKKKDELINELNKENTELKNKIEQIKSKIKLKYYNNKTKGRSYSYFDFINNNNIIDKIKGKNNSNILNYNCILLNHCQSISDINLKFIKNKSKKNLQNKSQSKNKSKNISNQSNNILLNNINVSPIHKNKKIYFTPHNNNTKNNSKSKKNKNKVIYNSKTKTNNKINLSQNISINTGIPKSNTKTKKRNINKKNKNKEINISEKENIPINKTFISSSILRKNTFHTSNNSFCGKNISNL